MSSSQRGWVGQLDSNSFSLKDSIGGLRGAVESLLPGFVFVVAYVVTKDLKTTLIAAGGIAVVFVVVRLVQRTPLTQAFTGLFGVVIGVVWAASSGRAENYFAWGLVTNIGFCLAFLVSVLAKRSAISVLLQYFYGLPKGWRLTDEGRVLAKRSMWATWVWIAVFGIRVAVQLPLYFGERIVALGTVKLALGLPLFALGGWITWVLLRGILPAMEAKDDDGMQLESVPEEDLSDRS